MATIPALPKSRRAKIANNLMRQLATIKVANGYATDVINVSQDVRTWDAVSVVETPTIYVIDHNTKYTYHAGRLTERSWFIDLFTIMKQATQQQMEELIADIEDCLMANITLYFADIDPSTGLAVKPPGPCSHIRIREIITDNQLFSQVDGSQLFKITLEIVYTAQIQSIR